MFDVLVYVYENFWSGDACPELDQLGRKLSAAGFESDEIEQALHWLAGLNLVSHQSEPIDISSPPTDPVSHPPSEEDLRRAVQHIRNHWQRRYGLVQVG